MGDFQEVSGNAGCLIRERATEEPERTQSRQVILSCGTCNLHRGGHPTANSLRCVRGACKCRATGDLEGTAIEKALTRAGPQVIGFADGQEGLHAVRTSPTALIVLDMMLPELDGTGS